MVDIAGNQPILDERYGRGVSIVAEGMCHNGGQLWSFSSDKILLLEDEVQRLKGKADKKKNRQTVYDDKEFCNLISRARPEAVKIFEEIKKGGWSGKIVKHKKEIALKFYEANKWAYVKKKYLMQDNLYPSQGRGGQERTDFVGKLLKMVVENHKGFEALKLNYQTIYKTKNKQ